MGNMPPVRARLACQMISQVVLRHSSQSNSNAPGVKWAIVNSKGAQALKGEVSQAAGCAVFLRVMQMLAT